MKVRIKTATGRNLASRIKGIEVYIRKSGEMWAGTEEEFRSWAQRVARNAIENPARVCFVSITGLPDMQGSEPDPDILTDAVLNPNPDA